MSVLVKSFNQILDALGGEEALRSIATQAVKECNNAHTVKVIRETLKLQFGWPHKHGSQRRAAQYLDIHEGSLSKFRKGEDTIFASMPQPRLTDILWRLNIDPEYAFPERDEVLLSVMRATLKEFITTRSTLNDYSPVEPYSDDVLMLISDVADNIDSDMCTIPIQEMSLQEVYHTIEKVLSKNSLDYVLNDRRFGGPRELLEVARDWGRIYEFLPYQFVLLVTSSFLMTGDMIMTGESDSDGMMDFLGSEPEEVTFDDAYRKQYLRTAHRSFRLEELQKLSRSYRYGHSEPDSTADSSVKTYVQTITSISERSSKRAHEIVEKAN